VDINADKIQIGRDEYVNLAKLPKEILDVADYMIEQLNKPCLRYEFGVPVKEILWRKTYSGEITGSCRTGRG